MKRLFALALLAPSFALAQETNGVSYDYFDLSYGGSTWDVGATDLDASGPGGTFSVAFRDQFFIYGDYHSWEFDDLGEAGSVRKTLAIGKGFNFGRRWSIYGALGFTTLDLDVGGGNAEDESGLAAAGARIRFGDNYELRVGAEYADVSGPGISNAYGQSSVSVGGDMHLTDVVALSFKFSENEEEITSFEIGVRFYPTKDSSSYRQRR